MKWSQVFTVYAKELRDALRDRRTLISMFVVPALIIPGMLFGVGTLSVKTVSKVRSEIADVMVLGGANAPALEKAVAANPKLRVVSPALDYPARITNKTLRAALEIPPGFDEAANALANPPKAKIYFYNGEIKSSTAAGELERVLRDYREGMIAQKLTQRNLPASLTKPFEFERANVAPPEKVGGATFGGMVPYLLILLAFIGAMYPAIDLTAGEKERGTMETILVSPVGRLELALGKFLTIFTASVGTVCATLVSTLLSGLLAASVLAPKAAAAAGAAGGLMFSPAGLVGVVVMVLPLAVLFSSALLCLSLFAKTPKEAQTYISPLTMVIVAPTVIAMLPGIDLNARLALIPILNVSLVCKDMISGTFQWNMIALIFGSSCLYGFLGLLLAVRLFNRESVLFRS